jgi:hypothetical protein
MIDIERTGVTRAEKDLTRVRVCTQKLSEKERGEGGRARKQK